jgi:hypothetical protein
MHQFKPQYEIDTFHKVSNFLNTNQEYDLHGPLFWSNPSHQAILQEMVRFRTQENITHAPHLETPAQHLIEQSLRLDERSVHFVATAQNQVTASLRLTPAPFEISLLCPDVKPNENYFEFSRLCTFRDSKDRALVTRMLLIRAGLWLFSSTKAQGIVALCKDLTAVFMRRFGMKEVKKDIHIEGRGEGYVLMSASRSEIMQLFKDRPGSEKKLNTQSLSINQTKQESV